MRTVVEVVVRRSNLVFYRGIDGCGIQLVLVLLVVVCALERKGPSGVFLITLDPPSVKHGEVHDAVHGGLLSGSSGSLERTGRVVEPHIHTLDEPLGQTYVVAGHEDYAAEEPLLLGYFDDPLEEFLSGAVCRVRLAGKHELHGALGIVHYGVEPVEVAENKRCALVGGETAGETYSQHVGTESLADLDYLGGRVMAAQGRVGDTFGDGFNQLVLEKLAHVPYFVVAHLIDAVEAALVVMAGTEFGTEDLVMDGLPVASRPGGIVYTVGHVAYVKLFGQVALVHILEYLLAHLAVEHGHAVHVLAHIGGQYAHAELLVAVVRVNLAKRQQGVPVYAETARIVAQILGQQAFVEGIVSCGHGGMRGEQATGADELQGLVEIQMLHLYVLAQTLKAGKCGMAFVVMVDSGVETQQAQGPHAADTEQDLLLQTVLPVASVELMRHLTVFRQIGFEVGVEKVEVGTADGHFPDTGSHVTSRKGHVDGPPVVMLVQHRFGGNLQEVLGVVFCHLVALGGDTLGEVAIAVKQADRHHVHVHVRAFLQVVTCEDAEASGVYLEGSLQAVLHAEVCNGGLLALGLERHVTVELVHHRRKPRQERDVFRQFVISFEAYLVEYGHRIVTGGMPDIRVDGLEKQFGVFVPTPPEVLAKGFKPR